MPQSSQRRTRHEHITRFAEVRHDAVPAGERAESDGGDERLVGDPPVADPAEDVGCVSVTEEGCLDERGEEAGGREDEAAWEVGLVCAAGWMSRIGHGGGEGVVVVVDGGGAGSRWSRERARGGIRASGYDECPLSTPDTPVPRIASSLCYGHVLLQRASNIEQTKHAHREPLCCAC
jgi:hypothetical protein